tara:strand:- start:1925 stop:2110 length:186 start_codon:yes stop_codon:yes gene_type:complete
MQRLTLITFLVFMVEAIIHYNQGLNAEREQKFQIPPTKQFIQIAVVVLIFSTVSSLIIKKA